MVKVYASAICILLSLCRLAVASPHQHTRTITCSTPPPASEAPLETWLDWRGAQIDYLLQPFALQEQDVIEILGVSERAICVQEHLEGLPDLPVQILDALRHLNRFTGALAWQSRPGHDLGFPIPDREYLQEVRDQITFPPLLRSQEFLAALEHPDRYPQAIQLVDQHNESRPENEKWAHLFYQSRFLKTPDAVTHGRLLIWVPGNPEQWIQFGILTPDQHPETKVYSASIVSLLTQKNGDIRTAIVDYWREAVDDRIEFTTKVEAEQGGANCYNCHKSSVIPIHPNRLYTLSPAGDLIETDSAQASAQLHDLNARIKSYGPPRFGFGFDLNAYGPSVGPPDRERTLAEIAEWIHPMELSSESLNNVRQAMNCAGCHNPATLGRLNFPTGLRSDHDFVDLVHPDTDEPMPILREFIKNLDMPPHKPLTAKERQALFKALTAEYHSFSRGTGVLAEWLNQMTPAK